MPIEFHAEGNRCCPLVMCDHCGKRIMDGQDGNALWLEYGAKFKGAEDKTIWFTHKACNHTFERIHPTGEYAHRCAIGLDMFVLHIMTNVRFNLKSAKKTAAALDLFD